MSDLNQCTMTGRLGADPEVKRTQDGRPIVNLRLAVSDQWKDKSSGERRERTTWVPVVIFSEGLAKVAEQYLKKGSRILVQGAFTVRDWEDQSGQKRYATEIVLQGFNSVLTMLDGPSGDRSEREPARRAPALAPAGNARFDDSDEIPFAPWM